ncbi:hypothetical protein [Mesorhizobium sp. M1272]|uniref:hypothetical protein n=1 Tax=Mesorhizobium sp. M1272 TaxID=2957074 RepID=UPI00333C62F4
MHEDGPFFLFLGEADREGATSKLKAAGHHYIKKRLESSLRNWESIFDYLADPGLKGTLAKFNNATFKIMDRNSYQAMTDLLFKTLARQSHVIFVHESFYTDPPEPAEEPIGHEAYLDIDDYSVFFGTIPPQVRTRMQEAMNLHELNVMPYRTNAEMTVLAAEFVDQNERNLIFRLYVPSGRLWAREAERLLQLFRDYLGRVSGLGVRQDQFSTHHGVVYEFFSDEAIDPTRLREEFGDFSQLLDLCVERPREASLLLTGKNIDSLAVDEIIERYSKEARRLAVDVKHDRERKLLSIRHRMESELVDVEGGAAISPDDIEHLLEAIVPRQNTVGALLRPAAVGQVPQNLTVNIRPQIIQTVHGIVAQEISGSQHLSFEAARIIELAQEHGGGRASEIVSAVHELEDVDLPDGDRLSAKQKIKRFLFALGGKVGDVGLGVLQTYIERKLGL